MLKTANRPFGEWGNLFPHQAMTLAAIDRLVHHSTILEMNVESYRRRTALEQKRGRGRPRDAQIHRLIVAPRQSAQNLNNALALPINRDNHASTATAVSHPDCRSLLIQIVALHTSGDRPSGWSKRRRSMACAMLRSRLNSTKVCTRSSKWRRTSAPAER